MEGNNKGFGLYQTRRNMMGSKNMMMKKKKRNLVMRGIVNYLKSDSYFYSPIMSPLLSGSGAQLEFRSTALPGLEVNKPLLQNEGKLVDRLVKYLNSDTYLYAPLGDPPPPQQFAVKKVISSTKGQDMLFKTVTSTILSKKVAWQAGRGPEDFASEKRGDYSTKGVTPDVSVRSPHTPGLKEAKKQTVRRSYRISTTTQRNAAEIG